MALNFSPFFRLPAAGVLVDPDGYKLISEHAGVSLVAAPAALGIKTKCVFIPPGASVVDFVMSTDRLGLKAGEPIYVTFGLYAKQSVQISAMLRDASGILLVATQTINPAVSGGFGYGQCVMTLTPNAAAVAAATTLRVRVFSGGSAGADGCYVVGWKAQKQNLALVDDTGPEEEALIAASLQSMPLIGSTLVRFGDSITEFSVSSAIATRTGANVVNAGVGGTALAVRGVANYDDLAPVALVDAIVSGNWSSVDAAVTALAAGGDNNAVQITALKAVNFNSPNLIVTIDYGRNDFMSGVPLGTAGSTDETTFRGAVNKVILTLLPAFPQVQIMLITPHWGVHDLGGTDQDADTVPNLNGDFAVEYVDAVIEMAARNKVACLDMWRTSGINAYTKALYLADDIHPTPAGYDQRDGKIASALLANF